MRKAPPHAWSIGFTWPGALHEAARGRVDLPAQGLMLTRGLVRAFRNGGSARLETVARLEPATHHPSRSNPIFFMPRQKYSRDCTTIKNRMIATPAQFILSVDKNHHKIYPDKFPIERLRQNFSLSSSHKVLCACLIIFSASPCTNLTESGGFATLQGEPHGIRPTCETPGRENEMLNKYLLQCLAGVMRNRCSGR